MAKVKDLSLHNGKISLHVHSYPVLINKEDQPVVLRQVPYCRRELSRKL